MTLTAKRHSKSDAWFWGVATEPKSGLECLWVARMAVEKQPKWVFVAPVGGRPAAAQILAQAKKQLSLAGPGVRDDRQIQQWLRSGVAIEVSGTPFQLQVWGALKKIPAGAQVTYGQIASAVGRPRAVRAVGTAIGRNPISILIPCHRVVRAGGQLGGYRWCLQTKLKLLISEQAKSNKRNSGLSTAVRA
jgi:AraC family transcriptional regulator, regulatory protein of adaptative response / methylated-DNA-[protein]-cysteine methyltransferase